MCLVQSKLEKPEFRSNNAYSQNEILFKLFLKSYIDPQM